MIAQLDEGGAVDDVIVFGGAASIDSLVRRICERSGRPVHVGSAEAAALGNAIVQGAAIGSFASLDEGRSEIDIE